jgi:pyruvate kinase
MSGTKIIATIGPASRTADVLRRFIDDGVDCIRFNMSHGVHAEHLESLTTLRSVAAEHGTHIAAMADLCGPKVRTGKIDSEHGLIEDGQTCVITRHAEVGTAIRFDTNYAKIVDEVDVGHQVLIDDGMIRLRVTEKTGDELLCLCEIGGTIGSHKGINLPDSTLSVPSLTEKDLADLDWAMENAFDFVAISFVRHPDDIKQLRTVLRRAKNDARIIAKIETPQAVDAIDEIIELSDAILVARGDLGVEMDVTRLPILQKDIVRRCHKQGKTVIVATQMLHSMVDAPTPTRAEVSDVANAVLDGADAVMLSAESAVGKYPTRAVAIMNRICEQVFDDEERNRVEGASTLSRHVRVGHDIDRATAAVARSAALVAEDIGAKMIVIWCRAGRTARWVSKYHTGKTLVGLSAEPAVCRRLALSYALKPMLVSQEFADGTKPWHDLEEEIAALFPLSTGDFIVLVGDPTSHHRIPRLTIHMVGACYT